MSVTSFGVWDYVVFGSMLAASVGIGIYHAVGRKNQSTSEYLVAGHTMAFLPVAMSLIATFQSSIMMLGTPAESYVYGISWILGELGTTTGGCIDIFLSLVFLKRLDLSTPNEYLERRFQSRCLRLLANAISCVFSLLYMSVVLYGQGIALQAVTGFSTYGSIIVTACTAIIYTTIGGLKAVIWTDVLQFLIMVIGLLVVGIKGTLDSGGVNKVWTRASQSGRLNLSLDSDPTTRHTVWNLYFGRIIAGFGFLINPPTLQRISSTRSLTDARRAVLIMMTGFSVVTGMALVEGIVAYSYYAYKRCDPLASHQIHSPDQIIPFMIMDLFKHLPGMPGLFLAALSSASLSTLSSSLSAISVLTWYDLVKPCFPNMSDFQGLVVSKATVVICGAVSSLIAILFSESASSTLNQIVYTLGSLGRYQVIGLFYVGALFPFANTKGAVTGFLTGIAFMGWLVIGSMFSTSKSSQPYYPLGPTDQCPAFNVTSSLDNTTNIIPVTMLNYSITTTPSNTSKNFTSGLDFFYNISYTLYSTMALCTVLLVGITASLLTGGWKTRADPELVIHMADIQCCCPFGGTIRNDSIDDDKQGTKTVQEILMTDCPKDRNKEDSNITAYLDKGMTTRLTV